MKDLMEHFFQHPLLPYICGNDDFDDDYFDYDEDPAVDLLVMFTFALLDIPAGSKGVWDNWSHLAEGIRRC